MKKITNFAGMLFLCAWLVTGSAFAAEITGQAAFTGTAPERQEINMGADPTCASLHPEPVLDPSVIVNDNGTLRNVFVYVKEGVEGQSFDAPSEAVTLDQNGCNYEPHVFGVQVGQPIEIINSDSTLHNVHALPEKQKEFNLGMPIKGMKLKKQFSEPEVMVKFKCDVHPWMNAYAGVLNHPFYGVSDESGQFEITDLPAGTYTLEAWHETYGTQTQEVTVEEGEPAVVTFNFEGSQA